VVALRYVAADIRHKVLAPAIEEVDTLVECNRLVVVADTPTVVVAGVL
jgi:hypothetical protein